MNTDDGYGTAGEIMDRKTRADQVDPPQELWMLWNVDDQCWEDALEDVGMLCFASEDEALTDAQYHNDLREAELLPVRVI